MAEGTNFRQDPLGDLRPATSPAVDSQSTMSVGTVRTNLNMRSPAVRRLMREAAEMQSTDEDMITASPLEDNLFEWHFTFRGPPDTCYSEGVYHGRVMFPSEYPMKPPDIMLLTPNGRFETGTKICLSISNYHPETWLPSWSIRTALVALRSFMAVDSPGAIGSQQCSDSVRRSLAVKSNLFSCNTCGKTSILLKPENPGQASVNHESASRSSTCVPKTETPSTSKFQPKVPSTTNSGDENQKSSTHQEPTNTNSQPNRQPYNSFPHAAHANENFHGIDPENVRRRRFGDLHQAYGGLLNANYADPAIQEDPTTKILFAAIFFASLLGLFIHAQYFE